LHVVRTLLAVLMSAGLIIITGVVAVGPTAQAAISGAESAGRMALDAADTSASTPCVVSINAPKCQSTDPDLTVDLVNTGDTSACTFTYSIDWGDGSPAQQVTVGGEPQSGEYFLADHTYHATQTRTYSITASPVSVTGNCSSGSGSYTFTLDVGGTAPAAPSNLTVKAVDPHDIKLNWHDNSNNETGFEINNGVVGKDVAANSTTYTWGGLAPGTYMCFKIRAYNNVGDSAWDPNVSPWYVCTTTPKTAQVKYYAAMGDSYSSGLGNGNYTYSSICSESAYAYPALLHTDVPALGKLGFIACAGAVTDDFYTTGKNLSQLASLALLPNVRTVTLTIGGNDVGFAPVVKACLNQRTDCYKAQESAVYARINALAGKGRATTPEGRPIHALTALLVAIHREAPNAHIFVVGYPRLFGSNPKYYPKQRYLRDGTTSRVCSLPSYVGPLYLRYDDAQWFNQMADRINSVLASAVAKAGVPATFVSVRAAFTTHGDCDSGPSWFTPIKVDVSLLNIDIGNSALHPNRAGQRAYERNLRSAGI